MIQIITLVPAEVPESLPDLDLKGGICVECGEYVTSAWDPRHGRHDRATALAVARRRAGLPGVAQPLHDATPTMAELDHRFRSRAWRP